MCPNKKEIIKKIKADKGRFWAGDNISKYLEEGDKQKLIEELTPRFEAVLDSLVIDRYNDPNSADTGRRLAKMYINELMSGRYQPHPKVTAFPNNGPDRFEGMLTVKAEENLVRIFTPLTVSNKELDLAINLIEKVCKEMS